MKKILIVNNNLKVGGVQKALYNLLWEIEGKYDITLCLFSENGEYADKLPSSVKVVKVRGLYRYLGLSQGECGGLSALVRGACVVACRLIGRRKTLKLLSKRQPSLDKKYDCAISYLHNGRAKSFYGGTQDFVLNCVNADKKVAFLHCDYRNCGADNSENNSDMRKFDRIAACSDGCREAFLSVLPELSDKCVTVRNCHRFPEVRTMAENDPILYDEKYTNILVVARLSHEKAVDRAIIALFETLKKGYSAKLHIVGGGAMAAQLADLAADLGVSDNVIFYGEQENPYRYMKNADFLFISSYHEAAPMVIDEARSLGLPVLTVSTTSSFDMVETPACGWVCENSQEAMNAALERIVSDKDSIAEVKARLKNTCLSNEQALSQFAELIE